MIRQSLAAANDESLRGGMNFRSALLLTILTLVALLVQVLGVANETAEAQTASISSPGLPDNVSYESVTGTLFGNPCCIRSDALKQGALGDCFLISSLAAIAAVSPGTIQHAIQYNQANGTYTVTLYKPRAGGNPETAKLVRTIYTINGDIPVLSVGTRLWAALRGERSSFWSTFYNAIAYAHPVNDTLWPMLMEKAYAAMIPGGYNALNEGGGGYAAMRALTGASGDRWLISDKPATNVLRSVTVKNVPSVADRGGHCIICGIFNGKGLTAIEPNIQVCVSVISSSPLPRKCTPVCKPGYECTERFGQSGVDLGNNNAPLMVDVLDIDRPGSEHSIVVFEEKNPAQCTAQHPCKEQPDNPTGTAPDASAQPLSISFELGQQNIQDKTLATLGDLDNLLTKLTSEGKAQPVLAGTIYNCPSTFRCVNVNDHRVFGAGGLATQHEYFLKGYVRGTGTLAQARVKLGNPWGADQDITLSLPIFQYAFAAISTNNVTPIPAANCACR